jgi:Glycosyl hydrolases family 38 N-terminal domain/Alpha mannosidase middle domain
MAWMRVTLVPHTHWDREWYEPFDVFLERLVAMMDTLIELGDRGFPHFHLDGQTAMVDDYLAVRPEREGDVRRLADDGRLSIGPWVTQMDEFLVSGESHVRNLEMGLARARALGPATEIGYLPDQFGHIGQMPQILQQAGIDRAVVWRGVPREIDRTTFRWEAPDGSSVVTEYLAFGYFLGGDVPRFREPDELAEALGDKVERIAPFLVDDRVLVMVGSDHSGPDGGLPDRLAAADAILPDVTVRIGSLADHLAGPSPDGLPVWRGELRSSARAHLLPNVYSARVHQKRERGRVESLVERYAEPLAALVPGVAWPQDRLDRAWTLLLWNGAHDSVCGCCHDGVARDVDRRNAEARALAEAIADEALAALGSEVSSAGVLRFNPSPFEREGVPGLGWRVDAAAPEPAWERVTLEPSSDGWVVVDGALRFRLLDEPDAGDLYNFCHTVEGQRADPPSALETDGNEVRARWEGLAVGVRVRRRAGERTYELDGAIENDRPDHRVRLAVGLDEEATGSIAGSPFELVRRPARSEGGDAESASPTWPARHVVLAGDGAALHEGVVEYEATGRELFLTLLRCVGTISRQRLATRPWAAGPDVPTPDAQMLGTTAFRIGLRPGATVDDLLFDWERFALPLRESAASGGGRLPSAGTLLDVSGAAVLSNIRRRDGAVEARLWNPSADRAIETSVAGRSIHLGPARIETVRAPNH